VTREIVAVVVEDAQRCAEEVLFELVCTCNVKTLVIASNGVVVLPHKWAGKTLEEVRAECGVCLEVVDGRRQYLLVFFTLKMGLKNLAEIVARACGGTVGESLNSTN
jgi:hypothetical protein